ncbi:MAG: chemotaxis-specific protein-glutamate methyltransferase CheB [Alphaproteobacteria bacterium]|uniref:Protein-glutamate methylesterase/protein-glutamine glutaminase n=1 Tax=Candidatus Nitrobium versatile TaxID=2884831 RepID=A0A953M1I9_9BACT|nr:chemotaxis-specific protein-glutamate methyltransferase CheB [Candidatus Nitrobium versatile]
MKQIRVLVADDSGFARELIIAILSTDSEIRVVGEAVNGRDAVEKVKALKPDIVTLDIEMPVMDGLEAIEEIMASHAVPILVVTTRGDARTAYAAIAKGALDLVAKPDINLEEAQEFIDKIKLLSKIRVITHLSGKRIPKEEKEALKPVFKGGASEDRIVAIASSTGGPEALSIILSRLPSPFPCPIVIAQHISDGFVSGMVEWLKKIAKREVKVPAAGEPLAPGVAYVSPSERHMEVTGSRRIAFVERHPKDIYRPSCDLLLSSVAEVYGSRGIGIILTGMGSDGVQGLERIKTAGGVTVAQDEKTSVVFGMPKVAIERGCVDSILSLDEISGEITRLLYAGGTPADSALRSVRR